MAIPRKGSRRLVVSGVSFRWTIRRKATDAQKEEADAPATVAIERVDDGAGKLIVLTAHPHPQNYLTDHHRGVTPAAVKDWIEQGIELGWDPSARGSYVLHQRTDGKLGLQKRK